MKEEETAPGRRFARPRRAGFTLVEVLLAMGIFLIGIVAIATVFPTGIAVQRETVDDMTGQLIAQNAKQEVVAAALSGIDPADPLTYKHDHDYAQRDGTLAPFTKGGIDPPPGKVQPLVRMKNNPDTAFGGPAVAGDGMTIPEMPNGTPPQTPAAKTRVIAQALPLAMRSYPDTVRNPNATNAYQQYNRRDYYWYPFIKSSPSVNNTAATGTSWQGFIMILRRRGADTPPPQVRSIAVHEDTSNPSAGTPRLPRLLFDTSFDNDANNDGRPDFIQPGDQVLTDTGLILKVVLVDSAGVTVSSLTPNAPSLLYIGVNVQPQGGNTPGKAVAGGRHSPVIRIEAFPLPVQKPTP